MKFGNLAESIHILFAIGFMCFCLWVMIHYTQHLNPDETMSFIFKFIVAIFLAIWVDDNVIMPKIQLLDEEENKTILQMMQGIATTMLGWWLRGKTEEKNIN